MHGFDNFDRGLGMEEITTQQETSVRDFDDFYLHERAPQVRRAFLMLNCPDSAHDVVAESFTKVFERWHTLLEPGPYLNQCVLNGCRDLGRARKNKPTQPLEQSQEGRLTSDSQESVVLAGLLMELPFNQRAAIVYRYYGRQTENEIADALQCQPGSVGPMIHRALQKLRKEMK